MSNVSETVKKWAWIAVVFFAVTALAAGTYWNVLSSPDQVLAFNDGNIEAALSPTFHFPEAMVRIWDNETFFGAGGKQMGISVVAVGESLGAEFWRRWEQALVLGLCGLAFFWFMRQYRIGRPVAALAAAFLAGSSACHNFSMVGLAVRPAAMAFAALALGFLERGRCTGRWLPYAIAGGCLGLAITEFPDGGIFYALTTVVVFWWTHLSLRPVVGGLKPEAGNLRPEAKAISRPLISDFRLLPPGLSAFIGKFMLYVLCSGLLAWQTTSTLFATQIQGMMQGATESKEERYAWATQWSVPPEEMWNSVAGSYFGHSMRSAEVPYWGRIGRDVNWEQTHQGMRNFTMTGWHWGVVPCILLLALAALAWRRKRDVEAADLLPANTWLWLIVVICVGAMMLMWGRYFPLYRLFWSLPYFGTFRNPEKWSGPLTLYAGLGVAFLLETLWRSLVAGKCEARTVVMLWKTVFWTAAGMLLLGILIGMGTLMSRESFVATRLAEGYGAQAELIWKNAVTASFKVAVLAGVFAAGVWWVLRSLLCGRSVRAGFALGAVAVLVLGNQFFDNLGYAEGHRYQHFLAANPLTDFLDAHRTEGRIKLMPPRHPLLNNLRLTLLQLHGYDMFDPVSVSRMPADYAALFQALEKKQIRLWELGALRYCLTLPGGVEQLNQMDGNRGRFVERLALGVEVVNEGYIPNVQTDSSQQVLRLVEFTGALPKYRLSGAVRAVLPTIEGDRQALARLGADDFQPARETLIHAHLAAPDVAAHGDGRITVVEETPAEVKLEIKMDKAGWLIRSVKYDPDWLVTVDGQRTELVRANFLFQAVRVPAGLHVLEMKYRPSLQTTWVSLAGRSLLILLLICSYHKEDTVRDE